MKTANFSGGRNPYFETTARTPLEFQCQTLHWDAHLFVYTSLCRLLFGLLPPPYQKRIKLPQLCGSTCCRRPYWNVNPPPKTWTTPFKTALDPRSGDNISFCLPSEVRIFFPTLVFSLFFLIPTFPCSSPTKHPQGASNQEF